MAEPLDQRAERLAERLSRIRARDEKATQPPWEREGMADGVLLKGMTERGGPDRDREMTRRIAYAIWDAGTHVDQAEANADFISHAREDVPLLADHVQEIGDALQALFPNDRGWHARLGGAIIAGRLGFEQGRVLSAVREIGDELDWEESSDG